MNNNTDMTAKKEKAQESITSDILAFRGIRLIHNIIHIKSCLFALYRNIAKYKVTWRQQNI